MRASFFVHFVSSRYIYRAKVPIKSKTPRFRRGGIFRCGALPLALVPVTVREDHVVQVAPDPGCGHSLITLLSFIFTAILYEITL